MERIIFRVLVLKIRTIAGVAIRPDDPSSTANGPTAELHVAAVTAVIHPRFADLHLSEGVVDIGIRAMEGARMQTLDNEETPPPMPFS